MIATLPNQESFPKKLASFSALILKGLAQIMLQENRFTGFLFLLGIFYGSFLMGCASILATVCGTATAIILKYDKAEINKGLYGFSAALVGVGIMLFLKPTVLAWILVIFGSSLATVLQHFFIRRNIPAFTLPFVLITWAVIYFTASLFPELMLVPDVVGNNTVDKFALGFNGFGQVIFQDNLVSGILFFIAVLISSPLAAGYGFVAAIFSAFIAWQMSMPIHDISIGLFSYNAVLCAIVFAGRRMRDILWALLSVMLSIFVSVAMDYFKIIPLTFPFVAASCAVILLKTNYERKTRK